MPLYDNLGREIVPKQRYTRRPRKKPAKYRVSPKSVAAVTANQPNVEVILAAKHNINGVPYGPGRVVVSRKVARVLQEGERRAAWSDANFAGTRACVIGPGRGKGLTVREVASEFFDLPYLAAVPFGAVDKTGTFQAN